MRRTLALLTVPVVALTAFAGTKVRAGDAADADRVAAAVANCEYSFFPDVDAPLIRMAGYAAGSSATAIHRPLDLSEHTVVSEPLSEYGEGARQETLVTDEAIYSATIVPRATSCDRVVIRLDPKEIEIATVETNIPMRDFEVRFVEDAATSIRQAAKPANTANVTVFVYENGYPVIGAPVKVWADYRGAPPEGLGRTIAHEHLYDGGSHDPSILIGTAKADGEADESTLRIRRFATPLSITTNEMGEAYAKARPQYRGGVESILASATVKGQTYTVSTVAILTVLPRLVHFGEYFGRTTDLEPRDDFPFLLVGGGPTKAHYFNHFIRSDIGDLVAATLKAIWLRDEENRTNSTGGGVGRWIQLNDMSLEYGGQFKLGVGLQDQCNSPSNRGGHVTHNLGIDLDVAPCYTKSGGGHVYSGECYQASLTGGTADLPMISHALLEEYIVGGGRGVIFVHPERPDEEFYHYHIRFNPSAF